MNENLRGLATLTVTNLKLLEKRTRKCNADGDMVITIFTRCHEQKTSNVITSTLLLRDLRQGGYAFDLSSQLGCPVQCYFCGVLPFERNLNKQEIIEQAALLVQVANEESVRIREPYKISFSDGGELLLNRECLEIVKQLVAYVQSDIKISSVLPRNGIVRNNIRRLLLFKQSFPRTLHLQISMSSSNDQLRQQASRSLLMPMSEIATVGREWYQVTGRKPTLTFTLTSESHCQVSEIVRDLPPDFFRVRLHPYRPNGVQGVETVVEERLEELAEQFGDGKGGAGYDLVVGHFDPTVGADDSLLFSGTLSFKSDPDV